MFWNLFNREPKAFNSGWLPARDGHEIFYHEFGNPKGKPVLAFHGGPGSCSKPRSAAIYDLKKFRIILFDQRGCGKSRFQNRLYRNTTADTLSDAVRLLEHLGVRGKTVIAGGSFGSTLALSFAEKYPARVEKLVLSMIFLARRRDVEGWSLGDAKRFYPEFIEEVERRAGGRNVDAHFNKLLHSKKRADVESAVKYYGGFEDIMGSLSPEFKLPEGEEFDHVRGYLEIFLHYDMNGYFLAENQLLKNAGRIRHIPALIVHNRLDLCCPVEQAWELHKALPKSRLRIVPALGHWSDMLIAEQKALLNKFL
ncbi:MAG: alpha/beta fold hydrolase [Rickettsiales bacterium]|jgi:proline iminopeptidase|nr:alpha/beta fold hydrolase [Rickettsiales bacterium]